MRTWTPRARVSQGIADILADLLDALPLHAAARFNEPADAEMAS